MSNYLLLGRQAVERRDFQAANDFYRKATRSPLVNTQQKQIARYMLAYLSSFVAADGLDVLGPDLRQAHCDPYFEAGDHLKHIAEVDFDPERLGLPSISSYDLAFIALAHQDAAITILKNYHLSKRLNEQQLCRIGNNHLLTAILILSCEHLCKRLSESALHVLGMKQPYAVELVQKQQNIGSVTSVVNEWSDGVVNMGTFAAARLNG